MENLICSEFNFELFCYRVLAAIPQNPLVVIDMANHEAWLARRQHKAKTRDNDFRAGSRGRVYCNDLRRLVFVMVNGNFPSDSTPEFIAALKPLALKLLERYQIGELRSLLQ